MSISQDQYSKVNNLADAIASTQKKQIIYVNVQLGTDKETKFKEIETFLESHNYIALTINNFQVNDVENIHVNYLFTKNNLSNVDFLHTKNDKNIDYRYPTKHYLSSRMSDHMSYDRIDFINREYGKNYQETIQIKQFTSYIKDSQERDTMPLYVIGDKEDDVLYALQEASIVDATSVDMEYDTYDPISFAQIDQSTSTMMIILSILAMITLLICQLYKNKKEIIVLKMFGSKNSTILNKMFLRQILCNILAYIVTQFVCYFILIGNIRPVNQPIWMYCIKNFAIFISLIFIVYIIIYYMIQHMNSYLDIKKNGNNKVIPVLGLALKVIFIIMIAEPFIHTISYGFNNIKEAYILYRYSDKVSNHVYICGILDGNHEKSYSKLSSHILEYFSKNGGIYQDFNQNYLNDLTKQNNPSMNLNELEYPYIIVNQNYLKEYSIKKNTGQLLNIDHISNNTLLVPRGYSVCDYTPYCNTNCKITSIKKGNVFINHDTMTTIDRRIKKDPIILVKTTIDDSLHWSKGYLYLENVGNNLNNLVFDLKENGFENYIYLEDTSNLFDVASSRSKSFLLNFTFTIFLYFILIIMFQFQSVYLYYYDNKKEFALNCLFGKTFIQKYSTLITRNLIVYLIPIIYLYFIIKIQAIPLLIFLFSAIILDIFILFIIVRFFEKHKVIPVLKGDN